MSTKKTQSTQAAATPNAPRTTFTDSNANSFSDRILRWELLETNLVPLLDSMPHIKPVHAQLVQLLADAKALEFRLKGQKAAASQAALDRQAMVKTGEALRSRLASALSFEHGSTNVVLKEFGLRPRRPGGRKKKTQQPTPPPVPQPPPVETQNGGAKPQKE